MTIKETHRTGKENFITASCMDCHHKGQMLFHLKIEKPTREEVKQVKIDSMLHDANGMHNVVIFRSYERKRTNQG